VTLDQKYFLITSKNGVLDGTSSEDIDKIFGQLGVQSRIVFYFHPGLGPRNAGLDIAIKLADKFALANVLPFFCM